MNSETLEAILRKHRTFASLSLMATLAIFGLLIIFVDLGEFSNIVAVSLLVGIVIFGAVVRYVERLLTEVFSKL